PFLTPAATAPPPASTGCHPRPELRHALGKPRLDAHPSKCRVAGDSYAVIASAPVPDSIWPPLSASPSGPTEEHAYSGAFGLSGRSCAFESAYDGCAPASRPPGSRCVFPPTWPAPTLAAAG